MKKKTFTFVLFLLSGFLLSQTSFGQIAPRCDKKTMEVLMQFDSTFNYTRSLVSTFGPDGTTSDLTFKSEGNNFCRGTVTQDTNFLAAGASDTTLDWFTMFTFEFMNGSGRQQHMAVIMTMDVTNDVGSAFFVTKNSSSGKIEIDGIGGNFFFRQ